MSVVLSSLKLATIAQLTVLATGAVGALCAHHGIFEVAVLKKMSKLLTKVLLPALALSFYSKYSAPMLVEYGVVFGAATVHLLLGIALGFVAACITGVQSPYRQTMALTCGMPHPALPLVMLPAILINWGAVADDADARSKGLSTIGLYLTMILLVFATLVNAIVGTMTKKKKTVASKLPIWKRAWRFFAGIDHTLYCCGGAIVIGIIPPVKELFMPGGPFSWLGGTITATGAMSPAMSVFIIGGLVWNTRKSKLQAQQGGDTPPKRSFAERIKGCFSRLVGATAAVNTSNALSAGETDEHEIGVIVLSEEKLASYKAAFDDVDGDRNGSIDKDELRKLLTSLGGTPSELELTAMFEEADLNKNGVIEFTEFIRLLSSKNARFKKMLVKMSLKQEDHITGHASPPVSPPGSSPRPLATALIEADEIEVDSLPITAAVRTKKAAPADTAYNAVDAMEVQPTPATTAVALSPQKLDEFRAAFTLFDEDGSGDIDAKELGSVIKALGGKPNEEELKSMIAEMDADGEGTIDFDEFCLMMAKKMREDEETGNGGKPSFFSAVRNVSLELKSIGGKGASMETKIELLRQKLERQRMAAALWTAAGDGESADSLPTDDDAPTAAPPSMNKFLIVCCVFKLLVMPAACIAINQVLFIIGLIPDNKMLRLIINVYPAIPTAAALVARLSAGGLDDQARYCASCMMPMYLLSIPSIAIFIVVSILLIG